MTARLHLIFTLVKWSPLSHVILMLHILAVQDSRVEKSWPVSILLVILETGFYTRTPRLAPCFTQRSHLDDALSIPPLLDGIY